MPGLDERPLPAGPLCNLNVHYFLSSLSLLPFWCPCLAAKGSSLEVMVEKRSLTNPLDELSNATKQQRLTTCKSMEGWVCGRNNPVKAGSHQPEINFPVRYQPCKSEHSDCCFQLRIKPSSRKQVDATFAFSSSSLFIHALQKQQGKENYVLEQRAIIRTRTGNREFLVSVIPYLNNEGQRSDCFRN